MRPMHFNEKMIREQALRNGGQLPSSGIQMRDQRYQYYHPTTYPATILEPFNNVDEDIVVELDNRSDYDLFIKAKKDYTLDVDVQDEDNATIRVELFFETSLLSEVFAKMIDKINVRRHDRSNGLCCSYYYSYSSWFSTIEDRSLRINVCPEYLVQEMTWFMEMMEMNGFDLVPSKERAETYVEKAEKDYWKDQEGLKIFLSGLLFLFCLGTLGAILIYTLNWLIT